MAQSARRLTARPAESEHPGTEVNHFQKQQSLRKHLFLFNDFICLRSNAFVGNYRQIGPFGMLELGVD
jgi:hypothetical protein